MGLSHSPGIVTSGLIYSIDAANTRSYAGSGLTVNGLVGGLGGTIVNGTGFSSADNGSFFFDGTNDYINTNIFSSSIGFTSSNFTISLWTKIKDYSQYNAFVTRTSGNLPAPLDFFTLPNGYINVNLGGVAGWTSINSSSAFPLTWTYLTFMLNSTTMSIFYNGVLNNTATLTATRVESANSIKIGTREDGFTRMNGNISQVQIYNRALSSTEVRQNFNATRKRYGI